MIAIAHKIQISPALILQRSALIVSSLGTLTNGLIVHKS